MVDLKTADYASTSRSLPIALLRAREKVMGPIREMLADAPVNEQKWRVLRVLDENGPMEQTAIADAACLLLPSLTRILQVMQADGLVLRRADAKDRRRSIVALTPKGQQVLNEYASQARALAKRLSDSFGAEKLDTLLDLLQDLQDAEW